MANVKNCNRTGEGSHSDKIAQQACRRRIKRVRFRFHPLLRLRDDSLCSPLPLLGFTAPRIKRQRSQSSPHQRMR